jgi:hypothetical protein
VKRRRWGREREESVLGGATPSMPAALAPEQRKVVWPGGADAVDQGRRPCLGVGVKAPPRPELRGSRHGRLWWEDLDPGRGVRPRVGAKEP